MLLNTRFWVGMAILFQLSGYAVGEDSTITVQGTAQKIVTADFASLTFQVVKSEKTIAKAVEEINKNTKEIQEFLAKQGVSEEEVLPEMLLLSPIFPDSTAPGYSSKFGNIQKSNNQKYNAQQNAYSALSSAQTAFEENTELLNAPKPVGYAASRQMVIKIVDLQSLERIRNGLIEMGLTVPEYYRYHAKDAKHHEDSVRVLAVRNAREKAKTMAGELGVSLSKVRTIRETKSISGSSMAFSPSDPFGDASESSSIDDAPPTAGAIQFLSSVEIVFTLGDTEINP